MTNWMIYELQRESSSTSLLWYTSWSYVNRKLSDVLIYKLYQWHLWWSWKTAGQWSNDLQRFRTTELIKEIDSWIYFTLKRF